MSRAGWTSRLVDALALVATVAVLMTFLWLDRREERLRTQVEGWREQATACILTRDLPPGFYLADIDTVYGVNRDLIERTYLGPAD